MLDVSAALEGWATYELIERDGSVSRTHTQKNLILDYGLDQVATVGVFGLQAYFAVGTGSTVPATNQTALANETARTSSNGGISDTTILISDGVAERTATRELDFAQGNGNLTEWGFASQSSSSLNIRQLFRDGGGTPIVLTKTSDQKLRITHKIRVTVSPVVPTAKVFDVTGIGTLSGQHTFYRCTGRDAQSGPLMFNEIVRGFNNGGAGLSIALSEQFPLPLSGSYPGTFNSEYGPQGFNPAQVYIPGSYARNLTLSLSTSQFNGTIFGFNISSVQGNYDLGQAIYGWGGWMFIFDPASRIVKTNLKTLTLDLGNFSWGRA